MNTSERISIITQISRRLAVEEWDIIDLTLSQFGLPTNNSWSGEKIGYIINSVKAAENEVIESLATHFGIVSQYKPVREIDSPYWRTDSFRIFLSHISAYKDLTAQIQQSLDRFGVSSFVAHVDIEPTKEWQNEIEIALFSCDTLVALMTPNFHDSRWTDQEIGIAIGRGILIVPVRLGMDPYGFIGKYQGLQGANKNSYQIALEIVKIILKNKQSQKKMVSALVNKFTEASGFQEAKDLIALIEKVELLDDILIEKMKKACTDNPQVKYAFGVPEKIEILAGKLKNIE